MRFSVVILEKTAKTLVTTDRLPTLLAVSRSCVCGLSLKHRVRIRRASKNIEDIRESWIGNDLTDLIVTSLFFDCAYETSPSATTGRTQSADYRSSKRCYCQLQDLIGTFHGGFRKLPLRATQRRRNNQGAIVNITLAAYFL